MRRVLLATLVIGLLLVSGCTQWDDDGSGVMVSPAPNLEASGLPTWQSLWILNDTSDDLRCEIRMEYEAGEEPDADDPTFAVRDVAAGAIESAGDLCVQCTEFGGGSTRCEPTGRWTCRSRSDDQVVRDWYWWIVCE